MLNDGSNWRISKSESIDVKAVSEQFLAQQKSLLAIKLLCRLSRAVQKHRGASIACLDGDIKFTPVVLKLQIEIKKYLAALDGYSSLLPTVFDSVSWASIKQEWSTIVVGWKSDHPVQNYEFHCHLVEQVRKVLRQLFETYLSQPLSDNESKFRAEFETALIAITDTIERLARLRGLATHIASSKQRDSDLYLRMEFLLKVVPQEAASLYHTLHDMETTSSRISGLNHLALQQSRLQTLLSDIQTQVVDSEEVCASSQNLFEQATTIIDTYWQILDQTLVGVEDCIYQSFSA